MLRFILVSTILLAQALAALSKADQLPFHADSSCEERAKEAGRCYIALASNSRPQANSADVTFRLAHPRLDSRS
jgi:hypothetical protein